MNDDTTPIAADLDNTWDIHPEIHGLVQFIITGNSWKGIEGKEVDIPVYLNPGKEELMDIVNHKANVINKQKVKKFFEDQQVQVSMLKILCPDCKIVQVYEGRTAI